MPEKKTSGIKNFFEEFKAFAMRGNVLDMAVGVVVGSAFTAIVNSLVNDIISPIIGLFFNADFSDVVIQIGDVGIGVGAFLNAIINFLIVAFVLLRDHQGHQYAAQEARGRAEGAHHQEMPLLPERDRYQGCPLPPLHFEARGLPRSKAVSFPVFLPGAVRSLDAAGAFLCPFFEDRRKENQNFFEKSIAFSGESWYYIRVVTTQSEYGRLAQLVEHLLDVQEVTGSSPVPSTIQFVLEPDSL